MKDQIIVYTDMASCGETEGNIYGTPEKGKYTYTCTFPGHFLAGMKGMITVKKLTALKT